MAIIGIDASILLHGERAGKRHSRNLLKHLIRHFSQDEWRLLYFDRRGDTPGRLPSVEGPSVREIVSRLPIRMLLPGWRRFGLPPAEHWLGDVDVLFAPDLCFPPARRAPVLCTVRGVAYLAIPHLCAPEKVRALRHAFEYARRYGHHFLAVSESTRQDLLRLTDVPPERIHVVTHGVDPMFRPLDRDECRKSIAQKYGLERPFLLYVGVLGRHKNVLGLLKAYAASSLPRDGISLVMAGPFEREVEEAHAFVVRNGLDASVRFIGNVSPDDRSLVELYAAAIALVHASYYEGWCATPLEAMACGTAVVASDIPSVREVVGGAGLLVPTDDLDAWRDALVRIAADDARRRAMVAQGLVHVRRHTWKRASRRLRRVFMTVQQMGR